MVREVEQLVRAQRDFVADASHQLRTPLTALRLRLENLSHEIPEDGRRQLEGATVETERLARIVDGLLVLARAEEHTTSLEPIALDDLVSGRIESWADFAAERNVSLTARVPSGAQAVATPERLEQVLDNLLANALEVAPPGSAVEIEWSQGVLHVLDAGPGMSDDELRYAFDRFWRAGSTEGSGLGLAIVRRLVDADGGSIELRRRAGGGIDAIVTFRQPTGRHREPAAQALPASR